MSMKYVARHDQNDSLFLIQNNRSFCCLVWLNQMQQFNHVYVGQSSNYAEWYKKPILLSGHQALSVGQLGDSYSWRWRIPKNMKGVDRSCDVLLNKPTYLNHLCSNYRLFNNLVNKFCWIMVQICFYPVLMFSFFMIFQDRMSRDHRNNVVHSILKIKHVARF